MSGNYLVINGERMEDARCEEIDIQERREYEHYMDCYTDILEVIRRQ